MCRAVSQLPAVNTRNEQSLHSEHPSPSTPGWTDPAPAQGQETPLQTARHSPLCLCAFWSIAGHCKCIAHPWPWLTAPTKWLFPPLAPLLLIRTAQGWNLTHKEGNSITNLLSSQITHPQSVRHQDRCEHLWTNRLCPAEGKGNIPHGSGHSQRGFANHPTVTWAPEAGPEATGWPLAGQGRVSQKQLGWKRYLKPSSPTYHQPPMSVRPRHCATSSPALKCCDWLTSMPTHSLASLNCSAVPFK